MEALRHCRHSHDVRNMLILLCSTSSTLLVVALLSGMYCISQSRDLSLSRSALRLTRMDTFSNTLLICDEARSDVAVIASHRQNRPGCSDIGLCEMSAPGRKQ